MIDNLIFYGTLAIIAVVTFFVLAIIIQLSVHIFRFTLERIYWHSCKTIEQKWQFFEWKEHIGFGNYPIELENLLYGETSANESEIKNRYKHFLLDNSNPFIMELFRVYICTQEEYKKKFLKLESEVSNPIELKNKLQALYKEYEYLIRTRSYFFNSTGEDEDYAKDRICYAVEHDDGEWHDRNLITVFYNFDKNPAFRDYIHSVWQAHGYLKQHWFI